MKGTLFKASVENKNCTTLSCDEIICGVKLCGLTAMTVLHIQLYVSQSPVCECWIYPIWKPGNSWVMVSGHLKVMVPLHIICAAKGVSAVGSVSWIGCPCTYSETCLIQSPLG